MHPQKTTKWTGEGAVAVAFLALVVGLGLAAFVPAHRTIARRTWTAFRREADNPQIDVWTRLRRAANAAEANFSETLGREFFLAGLDSNLRYFLTGELASQEVLLGKDGWLFYKTKVYGDPIADYCGTNPFRESEIDEIHARLLGMHRRLAARGIRFVTMFLPNKEQIYDRYMPDSVRKASARSRADLLVEGLEKRGGLEIVYPKDELLAWRDRYPLYYKHDTHWNELGAWIAAQPLRERLHGRRDGLEGRTFESEPAKVRDLADLVGMAWYFDDDVEYRVLPDEGTSGKPVAERLLWIGDSFQDAMKPVLPAYFAEAVFVEREKFSPGLVDEVRPDVVVLQYVERSLDYLLRDELRRVANVGGPPVGSPKMPGPGSHR
jgi:hypothetical protein